MPQDKWRSFDQTISKIRDAFADVPADELERLMAEAVAGVRSRKRRDDSK